MQFEFKKKSGCDFFFFSFVIKAEAEANTQRIKKELDCCITIENYPFCIRNATLLQHWQFHGVVLKICI